MIVSSVLLKRNKATGEGNQVNIPTIGPLPTYPTNPYQVSSVSPLEGSANVSLTPVITMNFNRAVLQSDIQFTSNPTFPFTEKVSGNSLIITPTSNLAPGTLYTYIVTFPSLNDNTTTYHFTTTGPTQEFLPNTEPSGFDEAVNKNELETSPDVYVSNLLPYTTNTFAADDQFISTPTGHFQIIVTTKNGNSETAKSDFIAWLKSNGMNNSQIGKLDIIYK